MTEPLRISAADLANVPTQQTPPQQAPPPVEADSGSGAFWRSAWFYNPCAGLVAALIAGLLSELMFHATGAIEALDYSGLESEFDVVVVYAGIALTGGLIAAALASIELWVVRSNQRATLAAMIGGACGAVAGPVSFIAAGIVLMFLYEVFGSAVDSLAGATAFRAAAWLVFGAGIGAAAALPAKQAKLLLVSTAGGAAGGLVAGLTFDPLVLLTDMGGVSRIVGFALFAMCIGVAITSPTTIVRTAWLRVSAGPLAGKQFMLYRDSTSIGSLYESDVFLFKDPHVQSCHAVITRTATGYQLRPAGPVTINGRLLTVATLLAIGDQIQVGGTLFEYHARS